MRSTFKILTYINRNKVKADGTTAVLCRITIDGKNTAMTTGIYVTPDNWNANKREIIGSVKDNNRLRELRKRLETTYDTLLKEHGVVSAELLKNTVTGSVTLPKMLLEAGEQELIRQEEHCKAIGSMSSYRDCRNVQKRLREYVESRGLSDIAFTDITEEFGESYKTYLKTAFNYHRSYINRSLTWLNRLLYTAVDRDIIRANPLTEVRYEKKEHAPVRYLTREQLQLLMATPFDDERMELARRMFIPAKRGSGGFQACLITNGVLKAKGQKQNIARTSFYRHSGSIIMLIEKSYSGFTGVTSDPPSPPSSGAGSGSTSSPFFFRRLWAICSSIFLMS